MQTITVQGHQLPTPYVPKPWMMDPTSGIQACLSASYYFETAGSGSSWAPGFAVHSWIVEGSSYNFNTNSCDGSEMCGHYTQIVWRDTKKLECASVVCENGAGVFITCNYDPPGNYVGRETLLRESL
ncbi:pathogenesis-related protein PR-1 [Brassica rapa]|uniref:pathogenesis-related protein PR-1 n=1 Tax=Brassica campestris TaxID=3711 RepID=UPI00142E2C69|nr:pathogenesis-related protein PR-1 [Brassica rapa]